eukprot:2568475-Pleurochrysis_carterae.AAC.1
MVPASTTTTMVAASLPLHAASVFSAELSSLSPQSSPYRPPCFIRYKLFPRLPSQHPTNFSFTAPSSFHASCPRPIYPCLILPTHASLPTPAPTHRPATLLTHLCSP